MVLEENLTFYLTEYTNFEEPLENKSHGCSYCDW